MLAAKRTFNLLGYYAVPSCGLTPYPDQPLFDGIRAYQKDDDLYVDGSMMPGAETEQSVNNSLAENGNTGKDVVRAEEAISKRRREECQGAIR